MADTLRIFCNSCLGETRHGVLRTLEQPTENDVVYWRIVRCNGCDSISFYKEHWIVSEEDGGEELSARYAFPSRLLRKPKLFVDAPAIIDQLYKETIDAFNGSSFLFCAGGLRALVEGICADQGVIDGPKRDWDTGEFQTKRNGDVVRGKTLDCLIEGLAERGILTLAHAQVLHQHRYLGNEALHELIVPETPVLTIAINIIETVMEGLYSMQAQAEELRGFRARAREAIPQDAVAVPPEAVASEVVDSEQQAE